MRSVPNGANSRPSCGRLHRPRHNASGPVPRRSHARCTSVRPLSRGPPVRAPIATFAGISAEKPRRKALCLEFRRGRTVSLDRRQPEAIRGAQAVLKPWQVNLGCALPTATASIEDHETLLSPNPESHRLRRGRWPWERGMVRLAVILRRPPHGHGTPLPRRRAASS